LDSPNLGWSTGSGESQQEPLPKEQSTTTMTPPPLPPPLATTASAFMGHAVAAFVELTHKNSGEDASNNGHQADPPTQASASNGVGLFFGFAESIAVSFQEVQEQPNSPSPLGVTGDVWSVRFEGYHKEVCRRSRSALTLLRCEKVQSAPFNVFFLLSTWECPCLVSAVAASQLQDGVGSIPRESPSPARPTVVYAIVLAHSQDVGGRVCVCSVTALRRLPPLSSSLP
uniref:Mediator of RNA polymerase II transcription subunit 13 n=1 Tax=Mesocestoides corti TaxID=53468 RepID=A0A0R3UDJ1_MESCO